MCTRDKLIVWLLENVPADMEVRILNSFGYYDVLDLTDSEEIRVGELPGGQALFLGS